MPQFNPWRLPVIQLQFRELRSFVGTGMDSFPATIS